MKLFISPSFTQPDKADGGIRRVIEAMVAHLPDHGITLVDSEKEADIINIHAGSMVPYTDKPMIASCHGLYWTNYKWDDHYHGANRAVIEVMARAQAVTAPSNWVGGAIARGILHTPHTIYHGIDTDFWQPVPTTNKNHDYVLWNKARADIISNPSDLMKISDRMKGTQFVSTIGRKSTNLDIMGVVPYPQMVGAIKNAGVYLATARETFGIGTLEALAAGVPVAGWDFGGQSEIIKQGETGYLAPYGDYAALEECIKKCFIERRTLSINARQDAVGRWQWHDKIKQYADLFWEVYNEWYKPKPKYSIVIPAYNLGHYLPQALDSVKAQTAVNVECIVIDDCSTDNTKEIATKYKGVKYYRTPHNAGLCNVRNIGAELATGKYLIYLDADDRLHPESLEKLGNFLDNNPGAHIAYGKISFMDDTGERYKEGAGIPDYDWFKQMAHMHQFPIGAALMRREIVKRSGGFRLRDWRAEDAAWVARVTSLGIRAAKATDDTILVYRIHSNSKSAREARENPEDIDGNWLSWLPWAMAETKKEGDETIKKGKKPHWPLVPFGAQGAPAKHWSIDHHQDPVVSVVIPVGPGHQKHLIDTLDSVQAQTFPFWECIVVNDSGEPLTLNAHPWTKVIDTEGAKGPAHARNLGVKASRADLVYFLDSDDWLLSNCLDVMIREWMNEDGEKYIYTDYIDIHHNGRLKHQKMKPYNQKQWKAQHAVNILIHKADFWSVGGFDEAFIGWEDWDLPIKLAITGICGHHAPYPTFVYRLYSGKLRESAVSRQQELLEILRGKYAPYYDGGIKMGKCCGGSQAAEAIIKAKQSLGLLDAGVSVSIKPVGNVESVRMEFIGSETGARTFIRVNGKMLSKQYRGANTPALKYINAAPQDVQLLTLTNKWKVTERSRIQTTLPPNARPAAINAEPVRPPEPVTVEEVKPEPVTFEAPTDQGGDISITVAARRLAESLGVNINTLKGTGKNGKITINDVREAKP